MGETEDQVYRGVAGMFILDDAQADALELPHRYGVDDIPLIVQDKNFEEDGELSFAGGPISPLGRLGDTILVNGTWAPHLDVETTRIRLRLLNASGARVFKLRLRGRARLRPDRHRRGTARRARAPEPHPALAGRAG